jgi:hypothetical protein
VKVAQYEVLGNDAKRQVRPGRDDRIAWRLVSHAAQRLHGFAAVISQSFPLNKVRQSRATSRVLCPPETELQLATRFTIRFGTTTTLRTLFPFKLS